MTGSENDEDGFVFSHIAYRHFTHQVPNSMSPLKGSRYERGTTGGQVKTNPADPDDQGAKVT